MNYTKKAVFLIPVTLLMVSSTLWAQVPDYLPPSVFSLKLTKEVFSPGEDLSFELVAQDDVSGIDIGCCAAVFLRERPRHNVFRHSDGVNGHIERIEGDTYRVSQFPINNFAQAGLYTIERFSFYDGAGNRTQLYANPETDTYMIYNIDGPIPTALSVLRFRIGDR